MAMRLRHGASAHRKRWLTEHRSVLPVRCPLSAVRRCLRKLNRPWPPCTSRFSAAASSRASTAGTCGRCGARSSCSYASRDRAQGRRLLPRLRRRRPATRTTRRPSTTRTIDAVVIAVPPRFHLTLTLRGAAAGKHVLVEKPAFLRIDDYETVVAARDRAGRVVLVGENDHYKPLAVQLRTLLADGVHWRDGVRALHDDRPQAEDGRRLAQRRSDGRRRRVFRGRHSLAASRRQPRPAHRRVTGYRPSVSRDGPDTRAKSMMVAFRYDNGAVGSLYYSREIPSLFRGLRLSKLFGRERRHHVRIERLFVVRARAKGCRGSCFRASATSAATRRCIAISSRVDPARRRAPEMSLERAMDDQRLMDRIYADVGSDAASRSRSRPSDRPLRHHHHRQRRRRRHAGARACATRRRAILILERGDFVPAGRRELEPGRGLEAPALPHRRALARRARPRVPAVHALLRRRQHEVLGQRAVPAAARGLRGGRSTPTASRRRGRSTTTRSRRTTTAPSGCTTCTASTASIRPRRRAARFRTRRSRTRPAWQRIVEQLRALGLHPSPLPLGCFGRASRTAACCATPATRSRASSTRRATPRSAASAARRAAERDAVDRTRSRAA